MTIQWYPGHMTRAKRQIQEKLKLIDVVLELVDARLPKSSRNPMIDEILGQKPRLIVLNKADLADADITKAWEASFREQKLATISVDSQSGKFVQEIPVRLRELLKEEFDARERKGIRKQSIRSLIVGIPNVGKSTLINRLAGRRAAAIGDRPGITKGQQWIKVGQTLELLDTPGILWPKFEDPAVGYRLAATGAIKDTITHPEDVAFYTLKYMLRHYAERFEERYGLTAVGITDDETDEARFENGDEEVLRYKEQEHIVRVMEEVGRKRGCLQSGGTVNLEQAARVILRDLQTGKLGPISLERP